MKFTFFIKIPNKRIHNNIIPRMIYTFNIGFKKH